MEVETLSHDGLLELAESQAEAMSKVTWEKERMVDFIRDVVESFYPPAREPLA